MRNIDNKMMWVFDNGIEMYEVNCDCLKVYKGDRVLGYVYPADSKDYDRCVEELNNGRDPISAGWEDGNGEICSLYGWGEYRSNEEA